MFLRRNKKNIMFMLTLRLSGARINVTLSDHLGPEVTIFLLNLIQLGTSGYL